MFIKDLSKCPEFIAGDNTILRELFNPLKEDIEMRYSLAHAGVEPGKTTYLHSLKTTELYYILKGRGLMRIDDETAEVKEGQAIYIPPDSKQQITNIGKERLVFICIVDPAWKKQDETVFEQDNI